MKTIYTRSIFTIIVFILVFVFHTNNASAQADLTVTISGKDTICMNEIPVSYTGNAIGIPPPITFPNPCWSGSAAAFCAPLNTVTTMFSPPAPGTYFLTLTAIDGNGISWSATKRIVVLSNSTITNVSPLSVTVCQGDNVTLTASGATGYLWYRDDCTSGLITNFVGNGSSYNFTALTAGTCKFRVYGSGFGGCTSTPNFIEYTVIVNTPATVNAGPDQTICAGCPALLSGELGGAATSGTWSTSGSGHFNPNNTTLAGTYTPSAGDIASGFVTLTLTTNDPPGYCPPASDAMFLTIIHAISNNVISANQDVCNSSIPNLLYGTIPNGGNGTYTYQWERSTVGAAGPFTPILGATGQNYQPGLLPTTTWFRRIVISPPTVNSTSNVIVIQVLVAPTAQAGADQTICNAINGGSAVLGQMPNSATGGNPPYSYLWTTNPPSSWTSNTEHPVVSPSVTTTFVLQVLDQTLCSDFDTVVIYMRPYTIHANAGGDQIICSGLVGGVATLGGIASFGTGWGGMAPYTYLWSANPPDNSLTGQTTISNPLVQPTITTTYSVVVTDANGCAASDNIVISVDPILYANAGVDGTVCYNESFVLGGSPTALGGTPPYTYIWNSIPAGFISTDSNPIVFPIMCTTYFVNVTDAHGCRATDTVVVCPIPQLSVNAGSDETICRPRNGGSATLGNSPLVIGGVPPYSYNWTTVPPSGWSSNLEHPVVMPRKTTTYLIQVSDQNSCIQSDMVVINVYTSLTHANAGPDQIINSGSNATLGGTPPRETGWGGVAPYTYLWSSNPAYSWLAGQNTQSNPIVQPTVITTFSVIVTDVNGCTASDDAVVSFNQPNSPNPVDVLLSPLTINKNGNNINILFSPNPTDGIVVLNIKGYTGDLKINVQNCQGKVLFTDVANITEKQYTRKIDLSGLTNGVYFIQVITDGNTSIHKIIKQ